MEYTDLDSMKDLSSEDKVSWLKSVGVEIVFRGDENHVVGIGCLGFSGKKAMPTLVVTMTRNDNELSINIDDCCSRYFEYMKWKIESEKSLANKIFRLVVGKEYS